jgi:hypothetical protein
VSNPLVFREIGSKLQINGREIFQKERVDKELSRGPATELTRCSGNWMLMDGTKKALTASGTTEEYGKRGPQGSQVSDISGVTIGCGLEAEPGLQKIGKKGRDPAREIAPSLLCDIAPDADCEVGAYSPKLSS